jgi:hypothetical protein
MDRENVAYIHKGVFLFCHEKEFNYVICRKMDGSREHHANEISQTEKDKFHLFSFLCRIST